MTFDDCREAEENTGAEECREDPPARGHSPEKKSAGTMAKITLIGCAVVCAMLIWELALMLANTGTVLSWAEYGLEPVYVIIPTLETAGYLTGAELQAAWILLEIAIVVSAALLFRDICKTYGKRDGRFAEKMKSSDAGITFSLFMIDIFLSIAMTLILTAAGFEIESPLRYSIMDDNKFFSFASAAVWEEVITRVAYIGLPVTAIALIMKKKGALKHIFGGFGMSWLVLVLIFVSAILFGFAHESSWGLPKVLPTAVSGIILGYAYATIGLHASIAIHFITDYMSTINDSAQVCFTLIIVLIGLVLTAEYVKKLRNVRSDVVALPKILPESNDSAAKAE